MSPTPECEASFERRDAGAGAVPPGEEIVITGISGKYPESDDFNKFVENLYNKVDMVTTDNRRWTVDHPEMSNSFGKVSDLDKFDAQFFGIHYKQAWTMDPVSRKLLEITYSAITDAGYNPRQLKNRKISVFMAGYFAEAEKTWFYEKVQVNGFGLTGCAKTMYANRISYWLGVRGPSYSVDGGDAGAALALEQAYRALRTGQCEAAIVGTGLVCTNPQFTLHFQRMGYVCPDGKTRVFDEKANGHARSECISVVFLQKAKDAKRVYAEVVHVMSDLKANEEFNTDCRSAATITKFLGEFYSSCGLSPDLVEYVEAHGSGVPQMDREELEAISSVFCKNRKKPLLVGAVASNMGYSYTANCLAGIAKVIAAYRTGVIAGNLHLDKPINVPGMSEGKLKILTENTPFGRGLVALNCFGHTGINAHVLLKDYVLDYPAILPSPIPWLVTASGRREEAMDYVFGELVRGRPVDTRQMRLLHRLHEENIQGHMARGFAVIKSNESGNQCLSQSRDYFGGAKRPILFVFSGMGSQWPGMGTHLMKIPIFAASVNKCHKVLELKGLDLIKIMTDPDPTVLDNILHSFVGIAAIQIALTDVLQALGIKPDLIIGHSVGELGCAYADGCLTAEEMILSAYSRGMVSLHTPFVPGSMAAVGLGYNKIKQLCPQDIEVACHNGPESCTISGPADSMKAFVEDLTSQGVFAKEVACSNIAFHSRYIASAGPKLLQYLREVIPSPRARSPRWLSTSVPQTKWADPEAQLSSAKYHTNNLLNSVLFEETSRLIPADAITIEIAPHGLLQAILKRSLPESCNHIPLSRRGNSDGVLFLLEAVGMLYQLGVNVKVANLYPEVPLPVPRETPTLSHLAQWEHSENWFVLHYQHNYKVCTGERLFSMSLFDEGYEYLRGCVLDGATLFPEAAQLVLVWETLGMIVNVPFKNLSVVFNDIRFESDIQLDMNTSLDLCVMIQRASGKFEIILNGTRVTMGQINIVKSKDTSPKQLVDYKANEKSACLSKEEVYRLLAEKGYDYSGEFQSLSSADANATIGNVTWTNNWVTFLNSFIQLNQLSQKGNIVSSSRSIGRLAINVKRHNYDIMHKNIINVKRHDLYGITRTNGVEMKDLLLAFHSKEIYPPMHIHNKVFVPYMNAKIENVCESLQILVQIAVENSLSKDFKIIDTSDKNLLRSVSENLLLSDVYITCEMIEKKDIINSPDSIKNVDLMIIEQSYSHKELAALLQPNISTGSFILFIQTKKPTEPLAWNHLNVVSTIGLPGMYHILAIKLSPMILEPMIVGLPPNTKLKEFDSVIEDTLNTGKQIVLVTENYNNSVQETIKSWRRGKNGKFLSLVALEDSTVGNFQKLIQVYREHLSKGIAINVLKAGIWGGYRKTVVSPFVNPSSRMQLIVSTPGDIDSLIWTDAATDAAANDTDIEVHYALVTSDDVEIVTNVTYRKEKKVNNLGTSFSGITKTGVKLMGLVESGGLSSVVSGQPEMLWPVPTHWTLEDAATVPRAYAHAYYALIIRGALKPRSSILIHDGLSILGQSAINICLSMKCEIFTTVNDIRKKRFILKLFPELNENNITSSLNDGFELNVRLATNEKGCHMVLNTLTGSLRRASMRCLGWFGKMIDSSAADMEQNLDFHMSFLDFDRSHYTAIFMNIFHPDNSHTKKQIWELVRAGISSGAVRPLSRVVLGRCEAARACRLLAARRHYGGVLLQLQPQQPQPTCPYPRFVLPEGKSVLVASGNSIVTAHLLDRLVSAGVTEVVLNSAAPMSDAYVKAKIREWNSRINIEQFSEDLTKYENCKAVLSRAKHTVHAIIVTGFDRDDELDDLHSILSNLDKASRTICPELHDFVLVGVENAMQDVCGKRLRSNLPALVVQLMKPNTDNETKLSGNEMTVLINSLELLMATQQKGHFTCLPKANTTNVILKQLEQSLDDLTVFASSNAYNNMEEDTPLRSAGLTEGMAQQIETLLRRNQIHHHSYEKILNMTLQELKTLLLGETVTKISGLRMFVNQLAPDDLKASDPYMLMPTLASNGSETEDTLVRSEDYLVMVPGIEGHYLPLLAVTQRLKIRALVHHLPLDGASHSQGITSLARDMLKFVKLRLRPGAPFYLFGYSFGACVALEIARLLEKEGYVGKVFCLDGSPSLMQALLKRELADIYKDEALLKKELHQVLNEEFLKVKRQPPIEYTKLLFDAILSRLKIGLLGEEYKAKLKSEIVFIKAGRYEGDMDDISQQVKVYEIDADHISCLKHAKVADIVNRELDSNIINFFNKRNLCERYFHTDRVD